MFSARNAGKHLAAVCLQSGSIKPNGIEVPGRIGLSANRRGNHFRNFAKRSPIPRRDLPAARQIRIQLLQLLNAQGTGDVGQPVVETQQHHLVMPLPR